jgi:tRNA(Ile)-lysidine synthase
LALQRRGLQEQLYAAGIDASFDLVEHLRLNPGTPISVTPRQLVARDHSGALKLSSPLNWSADGLSASVAKAGSIDFAGLTIKWSLVPGKPAKNREYFDADKIGDTIMLRHWQPGDRFQPIGMPAAVKLQDLFTNLKVPRSHRRRLVLATTAAGEIFWVEGLRIAERFKIEPFTVRRLQWSWRRHETC